jgi:hypothetical protein
MYGLKSKEVKRQYPVMLLRFLDFVRASGETIEQKCISFHEFVKETENRKALESELMCYISFQEDRIGKRKININYQ